MQNIKIIGFDVDGTLVQHDANVVVWQIFHNHYMVDPQLGIERYRLFKEGKLAFKEWVRLDVKCWIDAHAKKEEMIKIIKENLGLTQDARETLLELKRRGYIIGLISGTLDLVTDELLKDVPFDFAFMNHLQFDENGYPGMYVFENCKGFIRTIPLLEFDPTHVEDLDTEGEDHIADETRYMCMTRPIKPRKQKEPAIIADDPLNMLSGGKR